MYTDRSKTLDYRTSETLESNTINMVDDSGRKYYIGFYVDKHTNHYTDGTTDTFSINYKKYDGHENARQSETPRFYDTEKGYRNAIKNWSKKGSLRK